ncbi:Psp2p Ecym_4085 [Eremothecium cymbalariae DBVPG|uniref:Uncharacterized protein n=1 Tax=Eremothecium cymbalariae (strain CBS 270.75 / DBVPG 7215 / KCTC 17166 / NRRL Y-17582) TaxID=931890 RepID=G8JT11_ERECY|nr:hypothetical protein Ecym_4085 [Eremothecium cymbalariae DBVPG\
MSLEEFLDDSSLNDSVWNENEIDLNAISTTLSNTTSLDLLKSASIVGHGGQGGGDHGGGGYSNGNNFHGSNKQYDAPYIIKFSNLPSKFSNFEIEDLFRTKFTRFMKFKMFWELNKNPSLDSTSVFDKNFTKASKVSFVQVYSFRDMDKIMSQWREPLMDIHAIKVEPAEFSDFQNYVNKHTLLTPTCADPAKPYHGAGAAKLDAPKTVTTQQTKPKSNPFGDAKPVDTQAKILQIEETVQKFHIEDTTILRKISFGEGTPADIKKVTLLKRDHQNSKDDLHAIEDDLEEEQVGVEKNDVQTKETKTATIKPRLTYSEVLQKAAKERDDAAAATAAANASLKQIPYSSSDAVSTEASSNLPPKHTISNNESGREYCNDSKDENDPLSSKFVFKDGAESQNRSGHYRGGHRGTFRGRGNSIRRGPSRGSYRGNFEPRGGSHNSRFRENSNFEGNGNDSGSKTFERNNGDSDRTNGAARNYATAGGHRHGNDGGHRGPNTYSLFRPAAGFLLGDSGSGSNNNNRDSSRGGRGGRGRGRGGRGGAH